MKNGNHNKPSDNDMEGTHPITSGELDSVWVKTAPPQYFEPLNENLSVDVVVVGAGITGVTTAYYLAKAGKKVALVDDGPVGGGETGRTTAHIVNVLDDRYYEFERLLGPEKTRLAAESHTAAIQKIETIVREENINCDFQRVDGYLFLQPNDEQENLDKELLAASRAGIKGIKKITKAPTTSFDTGEALLFPQQAIFHPLKYLRGVSSAIQKMGGKIFTETHISEFDSKGVKAESGNTIAASFVVVATNTPVNDRLVIHSKQAPYRTYVIAAKVPKGSIENALYWDTRDPKDPAGAYHYIRLQPANETDDWLIVGGEDHKTGQADDAQKRFQRLEDWTKERFPMAKTAEHRWSGQVMEPVDGIGYAGRNPMDAENIFVATGDSGNGITQGTVSAAVISDLILNKVNPWSNLYDPARKTVSAIRGYLEENLNVAAQYAKYLKEGDIKQIDELKRGHGAILKDGLEAIAVYRDEKNQVHSFSAVCPHLKCVLNWNTAEKTFDCPCHGSRFTPLGEVVNGPSLTNLEAKDIHKSRG